MIRIIFLLIILMIISPTIIGLLLAYPMIFTKFIMVMSVIVVLYIAYVNIVDK
jgi:hypothetical protein